MRTNAEYEFPDQIMVQVALERYEELLRKAEHYDNIVNIAIDGAYIPSWSKDKDITLDTGTIDKYLRIVESGKLAGVKYRLQQRLEDEKLMNYKPEEQA